VRLSNVFSSAPFPGDEVLAAADLFNLAPPLEKVEKAPRRIGAQRRATVKMKPTQTYNSGRRQWS